jgi:hypothetical protein
LVRRIKGGASTVEIRVPGIIFGAKGKEMAVRDSAVGIMTGLRTGRFGIRIQNSTRDFYFLQNIWNVSGVHAASYSVGTDIGLTWRVTLGRKGKVTMDIKSQVKESS